MKVVRVQVEILRPTFCNGELMEAGKSCEMRIEDALALKTSGKARIVPGVKVERAVLNDAPETTETPMKAAKKKRNSVV